MYKRTSVKDDRIEDFRVLCGHIGRPFLAFKVDGNELQPFSEIRKSISEYPYISRFINPKALPDTIMGAIESPDLPISILRLLSQNLTNLGLYYIA